MATGMRLTTLLLASLLSACTTLGFEDGSLSGSGSGSGSCDDTASGLTCSVDADCPADEECEHGTCQLHGSCTEDGPDGGTDDDDDGGSDDDDGGADDDDGGSDDPQGTECVADADCTGGLECEDGFCVPHGGN